MTPDSRADYDLDARLAKASPLGALQIVLCARSENHTAGSGHRDIERHGACALHRQMAEETFPLTPTGLRVRVEWGARHGTNGTVMYRSDRSMVESFIEDCEGTTRVRRLVLASAEDSALLTTPWCDA